MKTILLIDDDVEIHELTKSIVQRNGYRLISAYDGWDGLQKAERYQPDLIILDHCMPGQNGSDIYERFREREQFRYIPIIMLTGVEHKELEIKRFFENGLNAYLHKPFGTKELLNIIKNLIVITEINNKNLELRKTIERSRDFLENLIESCPVIIMTVDISGMITYVNRVIEDVLGYGPQEVKGRHIQDFFGESVEQLCGINSNNPISREYQVQSDAGTGVPIGVVYTKLFDYDGRLQGFLAVGQDLSLQKRLERELVEKERLTAITESIATINHKINNPLMPILGNIQLIRQDASQFQESHKEKLEIIETNARKICEVIKNFNKLTKPISTKYYGNTNLIEL